MNYNVIVTGASKGIGRAIAEEFAMLGHNVALISRHYDEVQTVVDELKKKYEGIFAAFECDVSDAEQAKKTFDEINKKFGSIHILVNNAGVNSRQSLNPANQENWELDFAKNLSGWDEEIAVNLTGVYICSYLAAGYMIRQGSGAIINISSIKGKEATTSPGYGASKAGVIHLTKDFAKALGPYGIRVNCVAPGFIDTGMTSELPDEKKAAYKKLIPQARFGTVQEVAKAVVFLAEDKSSYITGHTLDVNGGYLMD